MKLKLVALLVGVAISTSALADRDDYRGGYRGGYGHYENHYNDRANWIGPALIGGIIGYQLGQPRVYQYQPPPTVIYTQPQVIYSQPTYSTIPPSGYHYEYLLDGVCNCYRTVLVPN